MMMVPIRGTKSSEEEDEEAMVEVIFTSREVTIIPKMSQQIIIILSHIIFNAIIAKKNGHYKNECWYNYNKKGKYANMANNNREKNETICKFG